MRKHTKRRCSGKLRYRNEAEANLEIERAMKFRGETLRAYNCYICGNLHLTSLSIEAYRKFRPKTKNKETV